LHHFGGKMFPLLLFPSYLTSHKDYNHDTATPPSIAHPLSKYTPTATSQRNYIWSSIWQRRFAWRSWGWKWGGRDGGWEIQYGVGVGWHCFGRFCKECGVWSCCFNLVVDIGKKSKCLSCNSFFFFVCPKGRLYREQGCKQGWRLDACSAHENNYYGYGGQVQKICYLKITKVHIFKSI
jgi:hypothetical protein